MTQPAAASSAAFLAGAGCYLPSRIVTNAEVSSALGVDAEWIQATSGIEERRYAAPDETVITMAVEAARRCIASAGASEIGMVIVSSGTADRRWPGPAASVALALNLGGIPAIDLAMPSAGAIFGVALAAQMSAVHGDVLVIASERMSSVVSREGTHPNVAVLFGDGAAACLISRRTGVARILGSVLHSDATFDQALHLGLTEPMEMDGRTVIMQASRKLPQVITELLERHSVAKEQVGAFLMHQANQNLLRQVARTLGVAEATVFSNIRAYGNTSSASVLIALAEWSSAHPFQRDVPVVLAAFGAGLHWGAVLVTGS